MKFILRWILLVKVWNIFYTFFLAECFDCNFYIFHGFRLRRLGFVNMCCVKFTKIKKSAKFFVVKIINEFKMVKEIKQMIS